MDGLFILCCVELNDSLILFSFSKDLSIYIRTYLNWKRSIKYGFCIFVNLRWQASVLTRGILSSFWCLSHYLVLSCSQVSNILYLSTQYLYQNNIFYKVVPINSIYCLYFIYWRKETDREFAWNRPIAAWGCCMVASFAGSLIANPLLGKYHENIQPIFLIYKSS